MKLKPHNICLNNFMGCFIVIKLIRSFRIELMLRIELMKFRAYKK